MSFAASHSSTVVVLCEAPSLERHPSRHCDRSLFSSTATTFTFNTNTVTRTQQHNTMDKHTTNNSSKHLTSTVSSTLSQTVNVEPVILPLGTCFSPRLPVYNAESYEHDDSFSDKPSLHTHSLTHSQLHYDYNEQTVETHISQLMEASQNTSTQTPTATLSSASKLNKLQHTHTQSNETSLHDEWLNQVQSCQLPHQPTLRSSASASATQPSNLHSTTLQVAPRALSASATASQSIALNLAFLN